MTENPCRRPSLLPVVLLIGVWLVAVLVISLAFPGSVVVGFPLGALIAWPGFSPMSRYVRRAATARMFLRARAEQRAHGRDGDYEGRQRRMAALNAAGWGEAVTAGLSGLTRFLTWFPTGMFAVLALVSLIAGLGSEGLERTAAAACSGSCAVFALLTALRPDKSVPSPWGEDGRVIEDLRG